MFTMTYCNVHNSSMCPHNRYMSPSSWFWVTLICPLFSHNNSPCLHNNCVWSPRDSGQPSQWLCKPSQWLVCPQIDCLTLTLCNHHNDSMWHSWWLWTSQWFCVMFIMTYCDPQNEFIWPKMTMCYFMYVCMHVCPYHRFTVILSDTHNDSVCLSQWFVVTLIVMHVPSQRYHTISQ